MDKGLLVIIAIGIGIVYFATNFSGDKPADNDVSWTVSDKKMPYDQYYEEDAIGDRVLNLSSVSLDRAKSIWPTTPTGLKIAAILPDFALARTEVSNNVVRGVFRDYIMEYLENLEGRYLSGKISGEHAQKALLGFK